MNSWRIQQRYGYGAARIRLSAEVHRHPARPDPLLVGLRRAGHELINEHELSPMQRLLAPVPSAVTGLLVILALVHNLQRPSLDASDIQVVMMTSEPRVPELVPPPPIPPEVEIAPPPPEPPVVAKAEPPPPPVRPEPPPPPKVAELKPPPPVKVKMAPPPALPEPTRKIQRPTPRPETLAQRKPPPKPKVRIDALTHQKTTAPAPEPTRSARARAPELAERKRARVDLLASAPAAAAAPAPAPVRESRTDAPRPQQRQRVRVDALAAAPTAKPKAPRSAPSRAERVTPEAFATARRRPGAAPLPAAPAPALPATADSSRASTRQRATPAATPASRSHPAKPAPRFDIALAQQPSAPAAPAPSRATRRTAAPAARSTSRRAGVETLPVPTLGGTPLASTASAAPATRRSAVQYAAAPAGTGRENAQLTGVPLASLASCATDREEDSLKQKLVAAVTTQEECVSPAGTYRFVETKNLNAFLMWIERAPSRAEANRCQELALALACLKQQRR